MVPRQWGDKALRADFGRNSVFWVKICLGCVVSEANESGIREAVLASSLVKQGGRVSVDLRLIGSSALMAVDLRVVLAVGDKSILGYLI